MAQNEPYVGDSTEQSEASSRRLVAELVDAGGRFWRVIKYSSLYIALSATIEVGVAMALLGLPPNPGPIVVGLVTFAVYATDRITDVETDAISNPSKAEFIRSHEDVLYTLAAVSYGLAVAIAVTGGPMALALTLLPGTFWVFYASDWLEGLSRTFYRIKEILIVNTAIVAFAWAVTVTFLPLAFTASRFPAAAAFVFVYFFFRVFIYVEISNISDREGDRQIGVDTLPVVYGIAGTRRILYLLNLLTAAVVVVAVVSGSLSVVLGVPLFLTVGYSLGVITLIGRWDNLSALSQVAENETLLTYASLLVLLVP